MHLLTRLGYIFYVSDKLDSFDYPIKPFLCVGQVRVV